MTVGVAVLLLAITAGLTFLTWRVDEHSEQRLLARQLAQVGTLLTSQAAVLQVQLADMGQVAVNTGARPDTFARWAARQLQQTQQSLSLWRVTDGQVSQVAQQGLEARLPADGPAALGSLKADGSLNVLGILPGDPDRLAYALRPAEGAGDLVIYAESPLPKGHRLPVTSDSPLSGLDLALYLGPTADPEQLLESTAPVPIRGETQRTTVPFGTGQVTIVGASPTHLAGGLAAALPWIVLAVGVVLSLGAAAVVEYVSRRRAVAERLAVENERLYRQQRGIAGTLQHALLPPVPELEGVEVAARYVAGVDELDVGGDWFDVIEKGPGRCVFVVGDISGRGLPAATTMASLRFAVRAYLAEGHDIDVVLTKLRRLIDVDVDHQFATVLLGELDSGAGRLRLVSAGHFGPLLVADGQGRLLECPVSAPVGVGGPAASAAALELPAKGTLLAFTDGAVERRGEVIDTGLDRLRTAALDADGQPLPSLVDSLLDALSFEGQKDDTVILGLRWPG
ncbi:PP2C family protein-serine/threonine phosphatase [Petropleomorpha daqingensis]|uniref:PP2C family protein-serine/threonine phosphatase n=1 Tax=Petropleomorpha daqingensis TaxID=2026353 RepID=UPI0015CB020B